MADQPTLTSKQQRIYDFICERIDDRGFPPTIRDIGGTFGIRSPNGVMCHLKALEKKRIHLARRKSGASNFANAPNANEARIAVSRLGRGRFHHCLPKLRMSGSICTRCSPDLTRLCFRSKVSR